MGQVNSNVDVDNVADLGANIVVGVPNGDDSRGSNQSGDGFTNAARDKMDSIHCVKTRIDMLIEDCLNVKEANAEKSSVNVNQTEKNGEKENGTNDEKDSGESENVDKAEVKSKDTGSDNSDVVIVDKHTKNDQIVGKIAEESDNKGSQNIESDEKCSPTTETKMEKSLETGNDNSEDSKPLKMSDLINEMNAADIVQRQKRAVTFQTFIDKVLDSSLKQVTDQENIPTNILKLCQESMQPNAEATKEEPAIDTGLAAVKPKFDKSCTKIKPERKITLKDHIERFLELSFREETSGGDKNSNKLSDKKKDGSGIKNGFDNFNAQGLVNNMITQGLQINKLLSPSVLVNHSKNPQKSPDIRVRSDFGRHDDGKNSHTMEVKSDLQVPSASCKSDVGMNKGYGYHNIGPRSGHQMHMSPVSTGQTNNSTHEGHKRAMRDMRESHHAQISDSKLYERDFIYGRQYSSEFGQEHMHRPHSSVSGQGFHPRIEHPASMPGIDQPSHHPMMHPIAQSSRASSTAAYHHHLSVPPTAAIEEQRCPLGRPGRPPLHHKDCICPMCVAHPQQNIDVRDQKKMDYHTQRHSPNVPMYMVSHDIPLHMRSHPLDSTAAVMRPSHVKIPPGAAAVPAAYQSVPKLLPQHPPITSPKEYCPKLMVPSMGYPQGRRPSLPENSAHSPYIHAGSTGEFSQSDQTEDYPRRLEGMSRGSNHTTYPVRPSSMPSHDNSSHDAYPMVRRSPAMSDSGSRSSEASAEAPLDLSVKKCKLEMERPRSSSYSSGAHNNTSQKKLNPSNTFLRHLENSVDKYCQELTSAEPPGTIKPGRGQTNRSVTPVESKQALPYPVQSPRLPSPHSLYNLPQQRKLPSPHFTGGITMGQPLVESKPQQPIPRSAEFQYATGTQQAVTSTSTLSQQITSQGIVSTTPSNFDANNKRNLNTISKHEPIQNIIGTHDPNDILYLICTICTQTYGSPYGFRKHFRNQHGFEPRAEHTIVQTISATKTALHAPVTLATAVGSGYQSQQSVSPTAVKFEGKESTGFVAQNINPEVDQKSSSGSPQSRCCPSEGSEHSEKSVGQKEKIEKIAQDEVIERKYLECQECGKTFQLNDFGSYKRHCRQHNTVKVAGSYTCSDCHLSFPDQKALKEHYIVHVSESHNGNLETSKSIEATVCKSSISGTCFSCIKCDRQFDNVTSYNIHMTAHEQPTKLSQQAELTRNKQPVEGASSKTNQTVLTSLNVIPSQCIVKQAAESMTSQECPDSSWDDTVKPVPASADDKPDETAVENSDSGYSSVGSNSMAQLDEKVNENSQESPAARVYRQKSFDSNSENNEEQCSEDSFFYKHKKFSHYRKRESSSIHSTTPPKQTKLSDTHSDRGPPVSSSTTFSVDFKQCDSSQSEDTKGMDQSKTELPPEITDISSSKDREFAEKQAKELTLGKGEARHNLPFVWDRTTRSQRKTK